MTIINEQTRTVKRIDDSYVDLCIKIGIRASEAYLKGYTEEELEVLAGVWEEELELNY